MGKDPRDAVMDLVIADRAETSVITAIMDEDDVRTAMRHPLVVVRDRLGCAGRGRPALGVEVAPARVGLVPAHPGPLRPRRAAADARGSDPEDDVAGGHPRRHPAIAASCVPAVRRHHDFRSGDDPRRGDLRGSDALLDRHPARVRQRPRRLPTAASPTSVLAGRSAARDGESDRRRRTPIKDVPRPNRATLPQSGSARILASPWPSFRARASVRTRSPRRSASAGWARSTAPPTLKLKRQVAIKVLPASVAGDAERLARFQREAEVLASLNHPHIAAIHGLEESDGVKALVMELVEGPNTRRSHRAGRRFQSTKRCRSPSRSPKHSKRRTSRASSIAI